MQRITITVDDDLMREIDRIASLRGYQNRSEAIRDLTRAGLRQTLLEVDPAKECIAAVAYIYNHEARELSKRLTRSFHDHHALSLATLHIHLDQHSCMEVNVLKGRSGDVQHFSEHVLAERGVRNGQVRMMASPTIAEMQRSRHSHGHPTAPRNSTKDPARRSARSPAKG
jgi:CopG family transcriptional regulator, nickel-responsive regulator